MCAGKHEIEHICHNLEVALCSGILAIIPGILLDCPHSPPGDVGKVDSMDSARNVPVGHKSAQGQDGSSHNFLEITAMVDGYGIARQRHEGVACQDGPPGIARQHVFMVILLQIKLFGSIFEAVEKAGAACARGDFVLI